MESLIKTYSTNPKVTDFKKIFRCSPSEAYAHTFLAMTQYTFCFATQFAKWVSDVQRSIPNEYQRQGVLLAVVMTNNFDYAEDVNTKDVEFLLKHYNPLVLWNHLEMSLEVSAIFYKMIPDSLFFKKKGCLEESVKSPKFEYTLEMDATLTQPQFCSLANALIEGKKKLALVGPNYIGLVPLTDTLKTIDFGKTIFYSRVICYRAGINWKRLEVIAPEIVNNDIGPYFNSRTKEVHLPNDETITVGKNQIDFGGKRADFSGLCRKHGSAIIEQFVNYDEQAFITWFEDFIATTTSSNPLTSTEIPSITKFQKPNICPALYKKIYDVEADWNPTCHRSVCKDCDPEKYALAEESTKRSLEREERMYNW